MKRIAALFILLTITLSSALNLSSCSVFMEETPTVTTTTDNFEKHPGNDDIPDQNTDVESCNHSFNLNFTDSSYYCSKCGVRKDMLYQCNHEYSEFSSTEGSSVKSCVYCAHQKPGEVVPKCSNPHTFKTVIEPTFYDIGLESAECQLCSYSEVRVLQPLNTGSYVCSFTLQEYADGAVKALGKLASDIYEDEIADQTTALYAYPFGDLATYKEIRAFTKELVGNETTEYAKARKIYDWVIANISYSTSAQLYNVGQVWESKKAVCSQYVQLMHDMLSAVDIMSSYTSGYSSEIPWDQNTSVSLPTVYQHVYDTGHAIVTCYVDGKVIYMDPTWGVALGADEYFDMSNEKLASYFIPSEINVMKIIPEGVDVRNYSVHMRRVGDYILNMNYGNTMDLGATIYNINNLQFRFDFVTHEIPTQNYYISDDKQSIGSAFRDCFLYNANNITWYFLPDGSCKEYGEVYAYVSYLNDECGKNIELPMSEMFEYYDDCLYRRKSNGYDLEVCNSKEQEVTVPGKINGLPVFCIKSSAFSENSNVRKLTLGEGVVMIEGLESELEELYIPATLEQFGILNDTPIHTLVVSEQSEYFKTVDNVLYTKDGRGLIYYPAGKTDKHYTVADGTVAIIRMARNSYIESITLPNSLEMICDMWGLYNLSKMELPVSLKSIGQICATKLTEMVIPDGVTELWGCSLTDNYELKRIVLPKNLKHIEQDILINCSALEVIEISSENKTFKTVDGVLFDKNMKKLWIYPMAKKDTTYEIPEGVSQMSQFVFTGNEYLRELILPKSLKHISMAAFNTTKIEKINLNYVEKFDGGTFSGSDGINVLVIPSNVKELGAQEFYECTLSLVIENPDLITDSETFMRAEGVSVFLTYDKIGEKEAHWAMYVKGVYTRSQWEYVDGVPTLIKK